MEQAVEGSLRRVFPTTLQPVQLAKAAARAMEEAQVVGLRGAEVPNCTDCTWRQLTWSGSAHTVRRCRASCRST